MVANTPLPDQMRPPMETIPSQPADSLTPCSAFSSSVCAEYGNVWMISD
jgi:hypothetical protein